MAPVAIDRDSNPLRSPDDRRLNRIAGPSSLIIFGVTGDLSRKKLMPAVYDLANRGLLPPGFALVGFARRDWETQDFEQVVHDAVETVESLFTQRGQTLHVDVPDDLPPIVGDGPRLVQVFVNLLANANKFGPEGTPVHVTARVEGQEVVVTVDDAGTGVQESESGSIFERFYRSADQEPEPRGLGLGLWIVKSIVERHGGRVGASRTPEGLSRLVVALPLATGKAQA